MKYKSPPAPLYQRGESKRRIVPYQRGESKWRIAPWFFLALSAGAIVFGLLKGEYRAVLEKAVTVCLSCIGLG